MRRPPCKVWTLLAKATKAADRLRRELGRVGEKQAESKVRDAQVVLLKLVQGHWD